MMMLLEGMQSLNGCLTGAQSAQLSHHKPEFKPRVLCVVGFRKQFEKHMTSMNQVLVPRQRCWSHMTEYSDVTAAVKWHHYPTNENSRIMVFI